MEGTNIDQELINKGLRDAQFAEAVPGHQPDVSAARSRGTRSGSTRPCAIFTSEASRRCYYNKNAGNPNAWTYEADTNQDPAFNDSHSRGQRACHMAGDAKHKFALSPTTIRTIATARGR